MMLAVCLAFGMMSPALAEQQVRLADTGYELSLPDGMQRHEPQGDEADKGLLFAWIFPTLEMDVFSYTFTRDVRTTAEEMTAAGQEAELRDVGGIEMLCTKLHDGTDGADGVVYAFQAGDRIIEIIFWYADQDAADLTKTIIESIRKN